MSSKTNAVCKAVPKFDIPSLESSKQHSSRDITKVIPEHSPPEVISYGKCRTLIELTVKTTGRKRSSTMVSSSPIRDKAIQGKRRPNSTSDTTSWPRVLREQTKPIMKQSLQQLASQNQLAKASKTSLDTKLGRKSSNIHQKSIVAARKDLDMIPTKQISVAKSSEERLKTASSIAIPSTSSVTSSIQSIFVADRGTQCGGIFDSSEKLGVLNPVRTLAFLMKEMEDIVENEKCAKILTHMEQALFRIPIDFGKPSSLDLEAIALRTQLETETMQLEETSKKLNDLCESLREERDSLQRQVHKQAADLEEIKQKQADSEASIRKLRQALDTVTKTVEVRDKIIAELKEENKNVDVVQKVIADLKTDLNKQTELARQRHLEIQYLMLEKDKLSVLSTYKDSLLIELRNRVKELQNHIADQLLGLREAYVTEEDINPHISVIHGGMACSSPTSTSSEHSNVPTSWREISDVSLSTVEPHCTDEDWKKSFNEQKKCLSKDICENVKKKTKAIGEPKIKDNVQLDFISLPCGESSHTILLPFYKEHTNKEYQLDNKQNEDTTLTRNKKIDQGLQGTGLGKDGNTEPTQNTLNKDNKTRYSNIENLVPEKKKHLNDGLSHTDMSANLKDNFPHDQIGSNIKEKVQTMFDDIRIQSRVPFNIPSPPRHYPHPDWSDSTLPSISAASELNAFTSTGI